MNDFIAHLGPLLAVWLLAVVSPGPAFLMLSQLAAGRSRTAAFGAALGISLGAILFAALTLWGMAVVVTQIAWLGTALRIIGAMYLVYLGVSLFRAASKPVEEVAQEQPSGKDSWAGLRIGLLTALTNPKSVAFFLSLFAVMLPPDLSSAEKVVLLASGFTIEIGWYLLVAMALSTPTFRALYARARKPLERLLGATLLLLGIRLAAAEGR